MKARYKPALLFLPLFIWFGINPFQTAIEQQVLATPTPTYDPLIEPPLPPNPTEFELGRNLYWHWCMTCHGDRGQGLTDEFRGIWEPEHQNCWARGCHAGRNGDEGFPIPTIVPAIVNDYHLRQYSSQQELADYLKTTHPPQSPGILSDGEYHAIALFVFTMNERHLIEKTATPIPRPSPTETLHPTPQPTVRDAEREAPLNSISMIVLVVIAMLVLIARRVRSASIG